MIESSDKEIIIKDMISGENTELYNFDIILLSAILGGGTVKALLDIPNDIKEMKNYNKEHPLWVIWNLFSSQK